MHKFRFVTVFATIISTLWMIGVLFASGMAESDLHVQANPRPDQRVALAEAISWLVTTHQNRDGGYTSFSTGAEVAPSDVGGTLDAVLAIASAGYNPAAPPPGKDNSPVDYLRRHGTDMVAFATADGGAAGKVILALVAAGQDPRNYEGIDFVALLRQQLQPEGHFQVTNVFGQSLAILAISAVGERVPATAVGWLAERQAREGSLAGSWDDGFGTPGNPDATAIAVMALAASQQAPAGSLDAAAGFLQQARLESGGWEYGVGFGENANSSALVIQAYKVLGLDFYAGDAGGAGAPLASLLSWQGESGAFQADFGDGRFDDFLATVQAVPAVAGKAFPLPGHQESVRRALGCLQTLQDAGTGGFEQFAGGGVNAPGTARAIEAIVAAGADPTAAEWSKNDLNPLVALAHLAPDFVAAGSGGAAGTVLQAVIASGGNVNDFAGMDLILRINQVISPTGEYDSLQFGPFAHAEAMLGLLGAGQPVDPAAVDILLAGHEGGDWGGPDSNGIALNVLGRLDQTVPEALGVLRETQLADGGWGFDSVNPSSTSEVVQGLISQGENPFGPDWSRIVSGTVTGPGMAVLNLQGENGCWPNLFGPGDDPFGTVDAVLMLTLAVPWPEPQLLASVEQPAVTPELFGDAGTEDDAGEENSGEPATAVATFTATTRPDPSATRAQPLTPPETPTLVSEPTPLPVGASGTGGGDGQTAAIVVAIVAVLAAAIYAGRRRQRRAGA